MKKNSSGHNKIEKKTVKHLAKLCRLKLSETEILNCQKDLSKILEYIDKLKEIDIASVRTSLDFGKNKNIKRKDEFVNAKENLDILEKIIKLMPETKDGYLKVKKII